MRELYALDDERLLLVASDRISTFDVILPTEIPDKGRVLTGLSAFWFARTRELVPNHLLALRDDGRSTRVPRLEMLPIECVVRGYLAGSGWKDYRAHAARSAATRCRPGSSESDRLPEPIFTPATKAQSGHDENIDARRPRPSSSAPSAGPRSRRWRSRSTRFASEHAEARGIILADTKFEFGLDRDGTLVARRRGADARLVALLAGRRVRRRGGPQPSFDKQFVRDYCETLGWDKTYPGPGGSRRTSSPARAPATSRRSSG